MNKELAIECIKTQRQFVDELTREAFDMAIDMLSAAQPEIVIDRRTAMKVLEIVKCEECKHWNEDDCRCERPALTGDRFHDPKYFDTYPDDFCSYGERKE